MAVQNNVIMDDIISSGIAPKFTFDSMETTTTSDTTTGTLTGEEWRGFVNDFGMDRHSRFDYFTIPKLEDWSKKYNERSKDMMGLYEVYVVNVKAKKVHHQKVFAKDEVGSKVKALRTADPIGFPDDDVEIFTRCIGQWEDKKPKEVKIVKE